MDDAPSEPTPVDIHTDWPAALLIAGGITCLLHGLAAVTRAAVPFWSPSPLLSVVFFIIALLAFYRHRWLKLYRPYGSRLPIYLAELVLLLLLTRLAPLLAAPGRLLELLPTWWTDPSSLFAGGFAADALLVGLAWGLGHTLAGAIDQLHLQPGELPPARGTPEYENWERSAAAFDHRGAYRRVLNRVIGGGVVAIATLTVSAAVGGGAAVGQALVATGLYFIAGLLLLGWAQVGLLDTLWRLDGLQAPTRLASQWPAWLALLLVVVALLALLAPRSYALDPITLFTWLVQALAVVAQFIIFLITLPIFLIASLFGAGNTPSPPSPPAAMPPMPQETAGGLDIPFLDTLRSVGFWAVTLGLVLYSLRTLYQSRWGLLRWLPRVAVLDTLARLWRALLSGLRASASTLATALRASAAHAVARATLGRSPRPTRPTDPRGLVQFLYLSLIERAAHRGYPRRRGMTATEYSHYLAARLAALEPADAANAAGTPDPASARADLDTLTAAFLEARYSRHTVDDSIVGRARRALQHLLVLIRQGRPTPRA